MPRRLKEMLSKDFAHINNKDEFHKRELAQMKHVHELAHNTWKWRRHTYDTAEGAFMKFPRLCQKRNVCSFRPCRSNSARKVHMNMDFVGWRESLRRDVIKLPMLSYRRVLLQDNEVQTDELRCSLATEAVPAAIVEEGFSTSTDSVFLDGTELHSNEVASSETKKSEKEEQDALRTLQRLFLPRWRLYVHLMKLRTKSAIPKHFVDAASSRRRKRLKEMAIAVIISFLSSERIPPLTEFRRFKEKVIKIQQAFRRYKSRMDASVELNYRKVRSGVEKQYWIDVEKWYDREMDRRLALKKGLWDEMDMPNFCIAGRLPVFLLRRELRSAICCQIRRRLTSPVPQKPEAFLPLATYFAVLDNVCFVTGMMRDTKSLMMHLHRRPKMVQLY